MKVTFTVHGKPGTAGSKKAFAYIGKDGKPHAAMAPATKRQKPFMAAVAAAAGTKARGRFWRDEPLSLTVTIIRVRPKDHFGTGRNAGVLKSWAESLLPTSPPDSLKVCRAVEDALKGVLYRDDSQICWHSISKHYGASDQVVVSITDEI